MANFITRSLWGKQVAGFLILTLIPVIVVGYLSFEHARKSLEQAAFQQLIESREVKSGALLRSLQETMSNVKFLAGLPAVRTAFRDLEAYFKYQEYVAHNESSPTVSVDLDSEVYRNIATAISPVFDKWLSLYAKSSPSEDLLIVVGGPAGRVLYTQRKLSDLGASLSGGPLQDSGLEKLWKKVLKTKQPALVDFSEYQPSGGPAAFMGVPMTSESGEVSGIIAARLGSAHLTEIMAVSEAMGQTGQTYLVGQDLLMRSNSRFDKESSVLRHKANPDAVAAAFKGQHGSRTIRNRAGENVFVAYAPVGISKDPELGADFDWAVVAEMSEREAIAPALTLRWRVALTLVCVGLIVVVAALWLARSLTRPIIALAHHAKVVSQGDLSTRLRERQRADEIGSLAEAFDEMQQTLRKQNREILDGVHVLSAASAEISATVAGLSDRTAQTSSAVTETATTVEEVRQAARLASEKAKIVAHTYHEAEEVSQSGRKAIEDAVQTMRLVRDQMESIGQTVVRLSEHSATIGDIITAVKDLADQSNLLAVNASIEAARAGERGKGFAVVAQEIKALADQSKEATEQVRTILEDTRKWISAVVMATEQGSRAVEAGVRESISAGESIEKLSESVEESVEAASIIEATSEQQFAGVGQVSTAIASIEDSLHQQVEHTSQLEDAAGRLTELGEQLKDLVERYKL